MKVTRILGLVFAYTLLALPIVVGIIWYIMGVQAGLDPWIPLPFGFLALGVYLILLHRWVKTDEPIW